jgi:hypothetical protein
MEATIKAWELDSDRRSIFLKCYLMMTRNMLAALKKGEFHDPSWVYDLLLRFADYYFEALTAYEQNSKYTPVVWNVVHDAAQAQGTNVLQNLLLGVNAHINYDLVLALVDVLDFKNQKTSQERIKTRYTDHCHINAIIAQTIDAVQDQVVEEASPRMDAVDKLFGRLDEWLIAELITHWRDEVWKHSIDMIQMRNPQAREKRRREIEFSTQERAKLILLEDGIIP